MKAYTINNGHSFTDGANVKVGGETILMEDDVAAQHREKLTLVVEPVEATTTQPVE